MIASFFHKPRRSIPRLERNYRQRLLGSAPKAIPGQAPSVPAACNGPREMPVATGNKTCSLVKTYERALETCKGSPKKFSITDAELGFTAAFRSHTLRFTPTRIFSLAELLPQIVELIKVALNNKNIPYFEIATDLQLPNRQSQRALLAAVSSPKTMEEMTCLDRLRVRKITKKGLVLTFVNPLALIPLQLPHPETIESASAQIQWGERYFPLYQRAQKKEGRRGLSLQKWLQRALNLDEGGKTRHIYFLGLNVSSTIFLSTYQAILNKYWQVAKSEGRMEKFPSGSTLRIIVLPFKESEISTAFYYSGTFDSTDEAEWVHHFIPTTQDGIFLVNEPKNRFNPPASESQTDLFNQIYLGAIDLNGSRTSIWNRGIRSETRHWLHQRVITPKAHVHQRLASPVLCEILYEILDDLQDLEQDVFDPDNTYPELTGHCAIYFEWLSYTPNGHEGAQNFVGQVVTWLREHQVRNRRVIRRVEKRLWDELANDVLRPGYFTAQLFQKAALSWFAQNISDETLVLRSMQDILYLTFGRKFFPGIETRSEWLREIHERTGPLKRGFEIDQVLPAELRQNARRETHWEQNHFDAYLNTDFPRLVEHTLDSIISYNLFTRYPQHPLPEPVKRLQESLSRRSGSVAISLTDIESLLLKSPFAAENPHCTDVDRLLDLSRHEDLLLEVIS